jgi:hypothetical protein
MRTSESVQGGLVEALANVMFRHLFVAYTPLYPNNVGYQAVRMDAISLVTTVGTT